MRRRPDRWWDRAARLRWLAVPLSAYLAVAVLLPALNGAARREDFARHIAWVAGGCAVVAILAALVEAALGLAAAARTRMSRTIRDARAASAGRDGGAA